MRRNQLFNLKLVTIDGLYYYFFYNEKMSTFFKLIVQPKLN